MTHPIDAPPPTSRDLPTLTRGDILDGDRLLRLWLDRLKLDSARYVWATFFAIATPLLVFWIVTSIEHRFELGSVVGPSLDHPELRVKGMSFLGDTMVWPFVILIPILFVLLNQVISRTEDVFRHIRGVLSPDWISNHGKEYAEIVGRVGHIVHSRGGWRMVRWLCFGVGLSFFAWNTMTCTFASRFRPYKALTVHVQQGDKTVPETFKEPVAIPKWDTQIHEAPLSWAATRVWVLVIGYVWLPLILYKLLNIIYALYVFTKELDSRNALNIKPLAPDGVGGLSVLAAPVISFTYPMLVFGVMLAMQFLKENTELSIHNVFLLFAFIPIFLLSFFTPLLRVHDAMKRAKENLLDDFSTLFSQTSQKFLDEVRAPSLNVEEFSRLEVSMRGLAECYERIEKMPVWPFQISTLYRLITAGLLPAAIPIAQLVLAAIKK